MYSPMGQTKVLLQQCTHKYRQKLRKAHVQSQILSGMKHRECTVSVPVLERSHIHGTKSIYCHFIMRSRVTQQTWSETRYIHVHGTHLKPMPSPYAASYYCKFDSVQLTQILQTFVQPCMFCFLTCFVPRFPLKHYCRMYRQWVTVMVSVAQSPSLIWDHWGAWNIVPLARGE